MTKVTTRIIEDDYGRWQLKDNADRIKPIACSNRKCPRPGQARFILQPLRLELPDFIAPESTIAACLHKNTEAEAIRVFRDYTLKYLPLGLNCGCYARFHRQVAHMRHNYRASSQGTKQPKE